MLETLQAIDEKINRLLAEKEEPKSKKEKK